MKGCCSEDSPCLCVCVCVSVCFYCVPARSVEPSEAERDAADEREATAPLGKADVPEVRVHVSVISCLFVWVPCFLHLFLCMRWCHGIVLEFAALAYRKPFRSLALAGYGSVIPVERGPVGGARVPAAGQDQR